MAGAWTLCLYIYVPDDLTPELIDGNNAMVARNKNEFIKKTIYLLENPDEAQARQKNAGRAL